MSGPLETPWSCWEDELIEGSDKENVDPEADGCRASLGNEAMNTAQLAAAALNHQATSCCRVVKAAKQLKCRHEGKKTTAGSKKTLVFPKQTTEKRVPLADITHQFVDTFTASQLQPATVTLPV